MKRETLQRRASEGQRRIQQLAAAERAAAEALHQEHIANVQKSIRPEIKRLKAALAAAADEGQTSLLFKISCTYENILFKAVEDYCKRNNLSEHGRCGHSDDSTVREHYYQFIEITWA